MKTKKLPKAVKFVIRGLPLAGAAATAMLPLQRIGQQVLMLIVLLWIQVVLHQPKFSWPENKAGMPETQYASWWWMMNAPSGVS